VREFERGDIAQVAELWLKVFRGRQGPASELLLDYFGEMFFETPWGDSSLPSLVYEDEGRIVGFLGVIPRPMLFANRPVRVAVATQMMVEESAARPYVAPLLLRRFLAGPQDLSFSDGTNEAAEKLFQAIGMNGTLLYSMTWTKTLRAAGYLCQRAERRLPWLGKALRPLAHALDALIAWGRAVRNWLRPDQSEPWVVEELSVDTLIWCVRKLSGKRALQADYEPDSLQWLLHCAEQKSKHGVLQKCALRGPDGSIHGWYLYYVRRGGVAQVLQYGGKRGELGKVLKHLFEHARRQGAVALSGQLDPSYLRELTHARCHIAWPGYSVVIHSKTAGLADAIHRGDAFLSRLDGEWWACFSDPKWSLKDSLLA